MVTEISKRTLPYQLHRNEAALIEWMRRHPHGRIDISTCDGLPTSSHVQVEFGCETILFSKIADYYQIP